MEKLTVEKGIEIQRQHLNDWKEILKPHVYKWLEAKAVENNHLAKSGYDIARGCTLDSYVGNYLYYTKKS